jgi:AcrR family transcriptional regulator
MGAVHHQQRRAELLSRFIDYLLRSGMGDLSLRPAAAALGLTPRTLLYYFRSKEKLLADVRACVAQPDRTVRRSPGWRDRRQL